jgi:hypothetical protein
MLSIKVAAIMNRDCIGCSGLKDNKGKNKRISSKGIGGRQCWLSSKCMAPAIAGKKVII